MIVIQGNNRKQSTIVVVGVQRGGTSMVAGVLRELGVNLGKNLGNNHEDPDFLTKNINEILRAVEKRNSQYDKWGWKMPHSSEYILDILNKLRNPHVVVVFRNLVGIAESQMKRSDASFDDAFNFSANRLFQVVEILPKIRCPLMAVSFESAINDPKKMIDEIISFLNICPNSEQIANAISIVNPEVGYQRLSSESWSYVVSRGKEVDGKYKEIKNRKLVNIYAENNNLKKEKDDAYVQFDFDREGELKCVSLKLSRDGNSDSVRILADTGDGFSRNMSEKVVLYKGINQIKISGVNICGIRIMPTFDGIVSNVRLISAYC